MTENVQGIPQDHQIRCATDGEMETVARILGSAFTDDPVMGWICGNEPSFYWQVFHTELRLLYRHHEHVFINESGTGAAAWLPPGVSSELPFSFSKLGLAWGLLRHGGLASFTRAQQLGEVMKDAHPEEPHFYLHAIGARLDCQGRGIGSALLKHGTRLCDEAGCMAYLESSNVRNNPLYERFGFEVVAERKVADDGPTIWLMRRPAR